MIKFGPAGNSESFYNEGHKSTVEMPKWLSERGLDTFEYSFGRGINLATEGALKLNQIAAQYGIELSVHAPYFINFATPDDQKMQNSIMYVLNSLKKVRELGGTRVVVHPAAQGQATRTEALERMLYGFDLTLAKIYENNLNDLIVCPETMGKMGQMGTVEEVLKICKRDSILYPCIDFGHVNAREQGILKTEEDYRRIIDTIADEIGDERAKKIHIHFSKIQYGPKGELKHLTFADDVFGPCFEPLAKVLSDYKMEPRVICESDGTQAEDAAFMKNYYQSIA